MSCESMKYNKSIYSDTLMKAQNEDGNILIIVIYMSDNLSNIFNNDAYLMQQ